MSAPKANSLLVTDRIQDSFYYLSWEEVFSLLADYDIEATVVYGVPKGGMIVTAFLEHGFATHDPVEADFILDDIIDSGKTVAYYNRTHPGKPFCALLDKTVLPRVWDPVWFVFPWEAAKKILNQNK